MITYGAWIITNRGETWSVEGYATPGEAKAAVRAFAKEGGWTEPKWWQFWRWGEMYTKDIPSASASSVSRD